MLKPESKSQSDWDYFYLSPYINVHLEPREGEPGIFEAVVIVSVLHDPYWRRNFITRLLEHPCVRPECN